MKSEWEWLDSATARLAVPGGWLYKVIHQFSVQTGKHFPDRGVAISTCFVPDALAQVSMTHAWVASERRCSCGEAGLVNVVQHKRHLEHVAAVAT